MCLGVPARVVAVSDAARCRVTVEVSGVRREVNAICALDGTDADPATLLDRWVLVHVGFAMAVIDEAEAARTLAALHALGEADDEIAAMASRP